MKKGKIAKRGHGKTEKRTHVQRSAIECEREAIKSFDKANNAKFSGQIKQKFAKPYKTTHNTNAKKQNIQHTLKTNNKKHDRITLTKRKQWQDLQNMCEPNDVPFETLEQNMANNANTHFPKRI